MEAWQGLLARSPRRGSRGEAFSAELSSEGGSFESEMSSKLEIEGGTVI